MLKDLRQTWLAGMLLPFVKDWAYALQEIRRSLV